MLVQLPTAPPLKNFVGVSYERANCWDLVREFYFLTFGIELKHYYSEVPADRKATQALVYSNIGEFEEVVGSPEFGDIIVLKIRGTESHIAVYIGGGQMLHSQKTTNSVVEKVERWQNQIAGYYRLKGKQG